MITSDTLQNTADDLRDWLLSIRPYLPLLVVVGGYAPVFYRHFDKAGSQGVPLLTYDFDFASPQSLPRSGNATLRQMAVDGGFRCIERPGLRRQDRHDKLEHRRHETNKAPVYFEFIASLEKSGLDRRGNEVVDRAIQNDLYAATVRYVELLRTEPVAFDASRIEALGLEEPIEVLVVHPSAFLLQKPLIRNERSPEKKAKDMAYVVDVARVTRPLWGDLHDWIARRVEKEDVPIRWLRRAATALSKYFENSSSDGSVEAALVYRDFPAAKLDANRAYRIVNLMLDETGLRKLVY